MGLLLSHGMELLDGRGMSMLVHLKLIGKGLCVKVLPSQSSHMLLHQGLHPRDMDRCCGIARDLLVEMWLSSDRKSI